MSASRAFTTLDEAWQERVDRWSTERLKCSVCGTLFYEINNIGGWGKISHDAWIKSDKVIGACGQHAYVGQIIVGERWPCCGDLQTTRIDNTNKGCIRADHTVYPRPFDENDDEQIPSQLLDYLTGYRASLEITQNYPVLIRRGFNAPFHIVRRYDDSRANALGRKSPFLPFR